MGRPSVTGLLLLAVLCSATTSSRGSQPSPTATSVFPIAIAAQAQTSGPDLSVVIMRPGADPRPLAAPGQTVTVGVGVSNLNGDGEAHSVVLTVKLPPGLTLQNASPAPNKVEGSNLVWNLGAMSAHAFPETFEVKLGVAKNAASELTVSANVTSSDHEQYLENNTGSLSIVVRPAAADLVVQSTLDAVALTVGGPIRFGVSVSNEGNITSTGTVLTALLPQGVSLQSGTPAPSANSSSTAKWQLGDIEPGATRVVIVTIALDQSIVPGQPGTTTDAKNLLTFTFDATTRAIEANPADNHLEVAKRVELSGADLRVWLDVSGAELPGVLPAGKDVTYTVLYGNFGNKLASGVSVSLSLAGGLNLTQVEPVPTRTTESEKFAGVVLQWDVGDLRVGQSKPIRCRVHVASVPKGGSLVKATISFAGTDIDLSNNIAYSHWYAPRVARRGPPLVPPQRHLLRYFLWIVVFILVLGILLLVYRRTRHRATN